MTKKAMVDLYEKGIVPHIQIHDELCFSITDHEAKLIQETTEKTIILEVKNKVDYESGPNWGNSSQIKKMKDNIRYGIVGIGGMGANHANLFLQNKIKNGSLEAICDTNDEFAKNFPNKSL